MEMSVNNNSFKILILLTITKSSTLLEFKQMKNYA